VRPALRPTCGDVLTVRKCELAGKGDDFVPVEHKPSSLRARQCEAVIKMRGGPSPLVGMTRRLKSSHHDRQEGRICYSGGYTRSEPARLGPLGAPFAMPDDTNAEPLLRSQRAEAAYRANYDLLHFIAARRFKIPNDEVCGVIHDVFVSFIRHEARVARSPADERAWLIGGVCNASRYYWRKHRGEELPPDIAEYVDPTSVADDAITRLLLADVLRRLPERCRDLLRKRYSEGYTPDEIAAMASLARGSAKNLISKCLLPVQRSAGFGERAHERPSPLNDRGSPRVHQ
jgi:RNA polymerase sigma factor (sigma-70 family)